MKSLIVQLPDSVFEKVEEFAKQTSRAPEDIVREVVERRWAEEPAGATSIFDHEPASLGEQLIPWNSRAEMLEGFFDRD